MTPNTKSNEEIEILSEQIHQLYCKQYLLDHGEPYWTNGDYSKLEDRVKEYDRNIARWHLKALTLKDQAHKAEVEEAVKVERLKILGAEIVQDFVTGTNAWYEELRNPERPCMMCGIPPKKMKELAEALTPLPESDKSN